MDSIRLRLVASAHVDLQKPQISSNETVNTWPWSPLTSNRLLVKIFAHACNSFHVEGSFSIYRRGGYHLVLIGDTCVAGPYTIHDELGIVVSSTVWAARDEKIDAKPHKMTFRTDYLQAWATGGYEDSGSRRAS